MTRTPSLRVQFLLLLITVSPCAAATPLQSQLYWWDSRGVMRANVDGSDITVLRETHLGDLLVDQRTNSLYHASFEVGRSDLDGSNLVTLFNEPDSWVGYSSVVLDYLRDQLYFVDAGRSAVYRMESDGANPTVIIPSDGLNISYTRIHNLQVDSLGEKLYWTHMKTFRRSNIDGSGAETLFTVSEWPSQIQLDAATGKVYWAMWNGIPGEGSINRANLDGSQQETLVAGLWGAYGIALDVRAGKMYFSDYWTSGPTNYDGTIRSANLDGSMVRTVMNFGPMYGPQELALNTATIPEPHTKYLLCMLPLAVLLRRTHAK